MFVEGSMYCGNGEYDSSLKKKTDIAGSLTTPSFFALLDLVTIRKAVVSIRLA